MKRLSMLLLAALTMWAGALMARAQVRVADAPVQARAVAVVHPTAGNRCEGTVWFTQTGEQVVVVVDLTGLKPNAKRGFHIHEFGDCTSPDAKSAGGHYNPQGTAHASPSDAKHHAGDLGNVTADDQGRVHYEITVNDISVNGPTNPILGRAVIVHADPDDLKSQPSGNAGARIGCGVIGLAEVKK